MGFIQRKKHAGRLASRSAYSIRSFPRALLSITCALLLGVPAVHAAEHPGLKHVVVYDDPAFYSSFPSIVRLDGDELLAAFRRAPDRRVFGRGGVSHTDPNSYLVSVRSTDGGNTWSAAPEMIFAHPFGGSQDPCMIRLKSGSILCSSYGWMFSPPAEASKLPKDVFRAGDFVFLGGYLLRSNDDGTSWSGPIVPPPAHDEARRDPFGNPVPAYNRGAMWEGRDGTLYWVVAASHTNSPARTSVHLMVSNDEGSSWKYRAPVARDEKVEFNEASIIETKKGDLVSFVRTAGFNDHTVIARSTDAGKTFKWEDAGFQGHPHQMLPLPDGRVLLVYGYRHAPFGIRARILNEDCSNAADAKEIILREDGGNSDIGYPWAAMASDERALVVYYFNKANGTRHIAGTFLDLKEFPSQVTD